MISVTTLILRHLALTISGHPGLMKAKEVLSLPGAHVTPFPVAFYTPNAETQKFKKQHKIYGDYRENGLDYAD